MSFSLCHQIATINIPRNKDFSENYTFYPPSRRVLYFQLASNPSAFMARHLFFLLLFFLIFCISVDFSGADVSSVNIDCGSSSKTYTDENSIVWSGDTDYISNGESKVVQTGNSISHVMDSLRVFTTRRKNCYTIPTTQGVKILARASFYYGNYDQKSSPPSFDLQFDGNNWVTVQTSTDSEVYYEAIYAVNADSTSICVAQTTPGQFPFISALEIRALDPSMYSSMEDGHALFLTRRIAFGANDTIRYSDDSYDRIWKPSPALNGLLAVTNESPTINTADGDYPPEAALAHAVTTPNVSFMIQLPTNFPPTEVPVYMNLYFSEVTELDPTTDTRSFTLYKGQASYSDPISPSFGEFNEIVVSNDTASSNTTFYLRADSGSTLPPLINAMEVFLVSDPLTDGTNSDDEATLLQTNFDVLQEWGGDPCLPAPYSWEWVNCSSDPTPRITALYLSSFGLSGMLPDLSSMESLQTIDLHNNSLNGPIPDTLGSLRNLKQLNLANNKFSGPIPASLSNNKNLNLVVTGNPDLCTSGTSCKVTPLTPSGSSGNGSSGSKKKSSKLPIILGITIPVFVLIWAVVGFFAILHYKRKSAAVTSVNNTPGQNGGANGANNGGGIDVAAIGKVGLAAFKAYARNDDNNSSDNATSSTNNQSA
ncbi:OLC1v1004153C2 [Oldenlandia corymbosa var. corymbosa]|uniref:OLC1v1004153C2 n=1 Tax=Oldenlandia corymbosa var. corymbosa TaxID=529605 RepID=A0AAV1DBP1_OLDCO|nr:OLC1v1004153C2 [Oldenlandia corymbosa var. corymbosa]